MSERKKIHIGIDVGGTKTEVAFLTESTILKRVRMQTDRNADYTNFIERITTLIDTELDQLQTNDDQVTFIGAGLPGSVHPFKQVMIQGNTSMFIGKPFLNDVCEQMGWTTLPRRIDNDANCFLMAEARMGITQEWIKERNIPKEELCLVGLTLGTGLGGSIFMNQRILHGGRGGAGELGHITLRTHGRKCYCGKSGCAEAYLSGTGIEASFKQRDSQGPTLTSRQIFDQARKGDPICKAVVQEFTDLWVEFLSNLSNAFDPHAFIIGGGVSAEPEVYAGVSDRLSRECFLTANPPAVLQNRLGDSAGSIGAALLNDF